MTAEDDFLKQLTRSDPWIAAITAKRIEAALEGFKLPLAGNWTYARLTSEIQDVANAGRDVARQSNAKSVAEMEKLADKAKALLNGLKRLGNTSQTAVLFELLRRDIDAERKAAANYGAIYETALFEAVENLHNILARSASQTRTLPPQRPRWTERDALDRRVALAVQLTPIFEQAYQTAARANNWAAEYGEEHPWPDFFQRIYRELFPRVKRLNLSEVLQAAARELPHVQELMRVWNELDATRCKDSSK